MREEEEYLRRLLNFTQRWEAKYPEEAATLRTECRKKLGFPDGMHLEPAYFRWLCVEELFREEVAKRTGNDRRSFLQGNTYARN